MEDQQKAKYSDWQYEHLRERAARALVNASKLMLSRVFDMKGPDNSPIQYWDDGEEWKAILEIVKDLSEGLTSAEEA